MRSPLLAVFLAVPVVAQSNSVPGLDVRIYDIGDASVFGRRGPAYPNGEIGINVGHSMCNGGQVALTWTGGPWQGLMKETYPKIASLLVRERDGRMVQVSGESYCKHSRTAFNFTTGPCMPCQSGGPDLWHVGCADIYSGGFSGPGSLGPTNEIDPWLGTFNPVGSYFDRGEPAVTGPQATDGIMSPIDWGTDPIKHRMILPERELVGGGTFYAQVHLMVIGEPVANRGNNQVSRQVNISWGGSTWNTQVSGAPVFGPVLTRWSGAQTAVGQNGNDDGRFMVGWKVTGPVDGFWHYELAVHNVDNAGGGAGLHIPVCPTARVRNAGFRDIDGDALNEWTFTRTGNEIAWLASANNPLNWNTLYNFWFDCDAAPVAGNLAIDRARIYPGALQVNVAAQVPGHLGQEYLGAGCGAPAPELSANGLPSIPNAAYGLRLNGAANAPTLLAISTGPDSTSLGNGCMRFLDEAQTTAAVIAVSDGNGLATWSTPIPASLLAMDVFCQSAQFVAGGPLAGAATVSNGLRVRIGGNGCQ
jgi:hypothetical protein